MSYVGLRRTRRKVCSYPLGLLPWDPTGTILLLMWRDSMECPRCKCPDSRVSYTRSRVEAGIIYRRRKCQNPDCKLKSVAAAMFVCFSALRLLAGCEPDEDSSRSPRAAVWSSGAPLAQLERLQDLDAPVRMEFRETLFRKVLYPVRDALKVRIYTDGPLHDCPITTDYGNVTVGEALLRMAREHGLFYEVPEKEKLIIRTPWVAGVNDVTNPELIPEYRVSASYPADARKAKASGKVLLRVVVHKDGRIGWIQVVEDTPDFPSFLENVLTAAKQHRYRPATRHGEPVDAWFNLHYTFEPSKAARRR